VPGPPGPAQPSCAGPAHTVSSCPFHIRGLTSHGAGSPTPRQDRRFGSRRTKEPIMAHRYQTILLFGAPGSGKGTQGKILGQVPGFYHLSCGDVFRPIDTSSDRGKTFIEYSSRGELVPDDVTIQMWQQNMRARTILSDYKPNDDLLV